MIEYRNSQICAVIDEYIHNEKHRYILKRRYCDHVVFGRLAEEVQMDVSTVKRIVRKHEWTVFKHLDPL